MKLLGLLISFVLVIGLDSAVVDPILTLSQGRIKGKIAESRNGRNFVQYLGIPYAKKPERFQEAGGPLKWDGLRDGTNYGQPCPQFDRKTKSVIGSEDCLFLNVFGGSPPPSSAAPSIAQSAKSTIPTVIAGDLKKRPVIVHLHGGSFVSQSGEAFGPGYLLEEDIILVTFNYRLSVLGFLSTGDKDSIANLGLRDQIKALKWVQSNIESIGGDKSKVTLYGGSSAGGAMASYLMLSPLAKGLFSGVISSSGNALCPWAVVRNPGKVAAKLGTKLNCPNSKTSTGILACLKGKSIKDIEIARVALQGFAEDPAVPFGPVVESWLAKEPSGGGGPSPVVPDYPEKLLFEGKFNQVPWLTGINSLNSLNLAVGNLITTPKRLTQLDQEWNKLAPIMFHFSQTSSNPGKVAEQLRSRYFGSNAISNATTDELVSAFNDRNWIVCTAKAASLQSKYSPVYLYYMSYKSPSSFWDDWGLRAKLDVQGPVHGDEIQHLFNSKSPSFPFIKKESEAFSFSEKMVKLWTSFARNGKPVEIISAKSLMAAEWSPVSPSLPISKIKWNILEKGTSGSSTVLDQSVQFDFWDNLDLGEVPPGWKTNKANLDNEPFAVGYASSPKPSPIVGTPPPVPPRANKPVSSPITPIPVNIKPIETSSPSAGSGNLYSNYGITPSAGGVKSPSSLTPSTTSSPTSTSTPTSSTSKSTTAAIPSIGLFFKDDDSFISSTTTTTTKKPGFFSKLIG